MPELNQDQSIQRYSELMRLVRAGAYDEREPDGTYGPDGVEAEIERLNQWAWKQGLKFVVPASGVRLEAMTDQEKAEYQEAVMQLTLEHDGYFVAGRKLEPGMLIRRYDNTVDMWFEGEIGQTTSYDHDKQQRIAGLSLVVAGYAPSPLKAGDLVEIISEQ